MRAALAKDCVRQRLMGVCSLVDLVRLVEWVERVRSERPSSFAFSPDRYATARFGDCEIGQRGYAMVQYTRWSWIRYGCAVLASGCRESAGEVAIMTKHGLKFGWVAAFTAAFGVVGASGASGAESGAKAGYLNCQVAGAVSFLFGSSRDLTCLYRPEGSNRVD